MHYKTLLVLVALCCCHILHAQLYNNPQPPSYSIVNQPGASLNEVVDSMRSQANASDTAEGGAEDMIEQIGAFWHGRVSANGTTGPNMFAAKSSR